jgi:hypothetical protein
MLVIGVCATEVNAPRSEFGPHFEAPGNTTARRDLIAGRSLRPGKQADIQLDREILKQEPELQQQGKWSSRQIQTRKASVLEKPVKLKAKCMAFHSTKGLN